jgi:DNA-binding XRE family transcriptional regulator
VSVSPRYVTRRLAQLGITKRTPKTYYRGMTWDKAQEIRRAYFAREAKQADLAKRFGVAISTISRIVSGHVWTTNPGLMYSPEKPMTLAGLRSLLRECIDEARS